MNANINKGQRRKPSVEIQNENAVPATKTKVKSMEFSRVINFLDEGRTYYGTVKDIDFKPNKAGTGENLIFDIQMNERRVVFRHKTKFPLSEYSPLNGLFASIADDDTDIIEFEDVIGQAVVFETRIAVMPDGAEFCNFKYIYLDEEEDEETDEEESPDEDDEGEYNEAEGEDLNNFFDDEDEDE